MFCNIKDQLNNANMHQIFAACIYPTTIETAVTTLEAYRNNTSRQLFGWVKDGEILGVCGFQVHDTALEILHIAVDENCRGHGIGRAIIDSLTEKHKLPICAETDDDAIDFYRKCGFEAASFEKYNTRRWKCILQI